MLQRGGAEGVTPLGAYNQGVTKPLHSTAAERGVEEEEGVQLAM